MDDSQITKNIMPLLLGGDLNSYNLARAFYEAYGIKSELFGRYAISVTKYSKLLNFHAVEKLDKPDTLVATVNGFVAKHPDKTPILLGCTDDYASLIVHNKERLDSRIVAPYIASELYTELEDKACFYRICDRFGILYPNTKIISADFTAEDFSESALGFSYPIIVKPSSSIKYWKHPFDGMKKVYVARSESEAAEIAADIFASGYDGEIILQDFIPGDDSNMRVLTVYSDKSRSARAACLGHVLLEEHTPHGLGNHTAIITEENSELVAKFCAMLDELGYTGFSNFDLKFDPRDNTLRAFEINLRQGRSNYYVTASGINIARLIVEDRVLGHELAFTEAKEPFFWHAIPRAVVWKYVKNKDYVNAAKALVRGGRSASSLIYKYDLAGNPRRLILVLEHLRRQFGKYKKYCR